MEDQIDRFFTYARNYVETNFASTISLELETAWRTVLESSDETALSEKSNHSLMMDLCDFHGDFAQAITEEDLLRVIDNYKYQLPAIH